MSEKVFSTRAFKTYIESIYTWIFIKAISNIFFFNINCQACADLLACLKLFPVTGNSGQYGTAPLQL